MRLARSTINKMKKVKHLEKKPTVHDTVWYVARKPETLPIPLRRAEAYQFPDPLYTKLIHFAVCSLYLYSL